MSATKEAMVALEHVQGLDVSIFCMDVRAFGKEFDNYVNRARDEHGVKFIRAMPSRIVEMPGSKNARVRYFDEAKARSTSRNSTWSCFRWACGPAPRSRTLAAKLGWISTSSASARPIGWRPWRRRSPGIYVAGAFQEPKDIPESVAQASGAAACAMEKLSAARGTMIQRHEYPWERDVTDESARVGVFICHCGHNIASVVDVKAVAGRGARCRATSCTPRANLYTCSDTNQQHIKDMIREHRLNRLVVASCSPRTHEDAFPGDAARVGPQPVPLRHDQHPRPVLVGASDDPVAATEKATDLMRMAVARARNLKALGTGQAAGDVQSALVLGGGLAGMTAALAWPTRASTCTCGERSRTRRQSAQHPHTLEGADVQASWPSLSARAERTPRSRCICNATPVPIAGHVGNFKTRVVKSAGSEKTISHGVIDPGHRRPERPPTSTSTARTPRDHADATGRLRWRRSPCRSRVGPPTHRRHDPVRGVRNDKHPYCSRVCCSEAVKNALEIKRQPARGQGGRPGQGHPHLRLPRAVLSSRPARRACSSFATRTSKTRVVSEERRQVKVRHDASTGREIVSASPTCWCCRPASRPAADNPVLRACCAAP
jgi:heterodisulfide reductase subunit A-like polyferredoxin